MTRREIARGKLRRALRALEAAMDGDDEAAQRAAVERVEQAREELHRACVQEVRDNALPVDPPRGPRVTL